MEGRKFVSEIIKLITFADMSIRRKLMLFSSGAAFWYLSIAFIGIAAAREGAIGWIIVIITVLAMAALIIFTVYFGRSLARPINTLQSELNSLAQGEMVSNRKIIIQNNDEIGALSRSFNRLLDTLGSINTFKKVIEEDDTPEDIYNRLSGVFQGLGLNDFQIYEVSNSKNVMRPAFEPGGGDFCDREIYINCNLCRAKKTGGTVSSSLYPGVCKRFAADGMRHHCIPMTIGDSTGGVAQFVFDASASPSYVSDIMRRIGRAERYIKEALPVLEAKRLMSTLKESSLKDPMTGLYNRRFLEEYVDTLVATVNRRSTILGLMMCDLDFFKQVNDTYGHNVGDTVLKETSAIIRNSVRASDIVVRYGGEEFLVLLKDLKGDEVARIAEKIRDKVAQTKVKISGGFVQKTISIGIAEFPKDTSNFWQGVKYSDVALYKAKQTGRNRVVRFDPSMWTEETY